MTVDAPETEDRRLAPRWPLGVVAAVLALVALVPTVGVLTGGGLTAIDGPVHRWAIEHRSDALTPIAKVITTLGNTPVMTAVVVLACLAAARRRQWRTLVLVAATGIGAQVLIVVGKLLVGRARPPRGDRLVAVSDLSFPSGHSLGAAAVVGVVACLLAARTRARVARGAVLACATIFVVAVGLSRIYLGVHWPTDVLGGWAIGALWLTLCLIAYRYNSSARNSVATITPRNRLTPWRFRASAAASAPVTDHPDGIGNVTEKPPS
ncbi:phosphatase PAP2 family protein [Nocardia sp. NPDC052566]|uniref:phosphatase PAP2 family protein n=1 Tax=Nocardia sp. NPDC052566 TaxID=3364330 RepID=UPI0037CA1E3B